MTKTTCRKFRGRESSWARLSFVLFFYYVPGLLGRVEGDELEWKRFDVEGRPAFVIFPEASKIRRPLSWVLYAPTFDRKLPNETDEGWMLQRFLDAGIAIAGVDVGESYGSPAGRASYTALWSELTESQPEFSTRVGLLARSRGGLMLYSWAAEHPERVACVAGIYPVCDLRSYPGLSKACGAYGLTEEQLAASLDRYNPIERLAPLAAAGVPLFHIHGDADRVVPLEANSGALSKRYWTLGGQMELVVPGGQGHNMWRGFFECERLVHFVIEHVKGDAREQRFEPLWTGGQFTEGPAAAPDGTLLFSDVGANTIYRYLPHSGEVAVWRCPSGRANGLAFDAGGRLIACEGANVGGGRRLSITELDGVVRTLAESWQGKRFNSPNDLALDAQGNVWFTDPRYVGDEPRELDFEGVFFVRSSGEVSLATRDVKKPNGIVLSGDGQTVFIADHEPAPRGFRQLLAFRVAEDGRLVDKRVLHDFGATRGIDGMTTDASGQIFATAGSGDRAGVLVFDGNGHLLRTLRTPGDPTNCTFGRGAQSDLLFVTAQTPPSTEPRGYGIYRVSLAGAVSLPQPVAHWRLDTTNGERALDSAGKHDGKVVGAEPATGVLGGACSFVRSRGDYIEVPYSEDFALSTFTVSSRVRLTRAPTFSGILGTRFGGEHTFDVKVNASKVHGDIGDGTSWIETAVNFDESDRGSDGQGGKLVVGRWYHITYVVDAVAGECRLYLDADLKRTVSFEGKPVLMRPGQRLRIGNSSSDEFMDGVIDDVRIWSQALSGEQVRYLDRLRDGPLELLQSFREALGEKVPLEDLQRFFDAAVRDRVSPERFAEQLRSLLEPVRIFIDHVLELHAGEGIERGELLLERGLFADTRRRLQIKVPALQGDRDQPRQTEPRQGDRVQFSAITLTVDETGQWRVLDFD